MKYPAKLPQSLIKGKSPELPLFDLLGLSILIVVMACLMFYDPFRVSHRIIDYLRLKFVIFVKEPRLLFYTYIYIGTFIAKTIAIFLIIILLILRRMNIDENLGLRPPSSRSWIKYILPFAIFSVCIRAYYATDPLVPNLPLRLVFPEAMVIGNAIIISSVLFIAPVAEELIFRGYMFDVFKRSFGSLIAILATSAIFAFAHFSNRDFEPLYFLVLFAGASICAIFRDKTNSIVAPIAFHGIYNAISILVGVLYYYILGY